MMQKEYRTYLWLAAGALLVAIGIATSFSLVQRLGEISAKRKYTDQVRDDAVLMLSELKDAETGQRGYALTGNESFLGPYLAVRGRLAGDLATLRQRTRVPAAAQHLDVAAPLLDAKLAELDQVVALRRNHQLPEADALVASGQGQR